MGLNCRDATFMSNLRLYKGTAFRRDLKAGEWFREPKKRIRVENRSRRPLFLSFRRVAADSFPCHSEVRSEDATRESSVLSFRTQRGNLFLLFASGGAAADCRKSATSSSERRKSDAVPACRSETSGNVLSETSREPRRTRLSAVCFVNSIVRRT